MAGELRNGGVRSNRGGKREGAGGKPDLFKAKCRNVIDTPAFWKWAKRVFEGDKVVPHATKDGVEYTEADVHERVHLWEKLAGYGFGKPSQEINFGEETAGNFISVIRALAGEK